MQLHLNETSRHAAKDAQTALLIDREKLYTTSTERQKSRYSYPLAVEALMGAAPSPTA
jgi:hypothetical protein